MIAKNILMFCLINDIFIYMNILITLYTLLPIVLVMFVGYLVYQDTLNKDARK